MVRTEIYFFNDDYKHVRKEDATRFIIRELDSQGNIVKEAFGAV